MNELVLVVAFAAGLITGVGIALGLYSVLNKQRTAELRNAFMRISQDTQKRTSEEFIKLANENFKGQTNQHKQELTSKKELIDQQLDQMNAKLGTVTTLIQDFENSRNEKIGALGKELNDLTQTTSRLQQALVNNRERGQWGERIAEDLLKVAGFVEGVSYTKQTSVGIESARKIRPDFTFSLPNGMQLNMDVKFPFDNYVRYVEAQNDGDKVTYRKKFLDDVGKRMKEVVSKDYINTEQNTLDCVLLFIPNEAIYHFLHDCSPTKNLFDEAMRNKVIICSPINLFAVLAVIRHASDNYRLEKSSQQILAILKDFRKQWDEYIGKMDEVNKHFDKAQTAFNDLITKRKNSLDKQLEKIDRLTIQEKLEPVEAIELIEA